MQCPKCGVSLPVRLSHCPNCGEKLNTLITCYRSGACINQVDDNDEPLSALRRKGVLLLRHKRVESHAVPKADFPVCCVKNT